MFSNPLTEPVIAMAVPARKAADTEAAPLTVRVVPEMFPKDAMLLARVLIVPALLNRVVKFPIVLLSVAIVELVTDAVVAVNVARVALEETSVPADN